MSAINDVITNTALNEPNYLYFYINLGTILIGIISIYLIISNRKKDLDDINSYDWAKFQLQTEGKARYKKADYKEKNKIRVKGYSKGNGFIKEEHKFPVLNLDNKPKQTEEAFLSFEEGKNLQDMINYAATINKSEIEEIYPIESLYSKVVNSKDATQANNEKINQKIIETLTR